MPRETGCAAALPCRWKHSAGLAIQRTGVSQLPPTRVQSRLSAPKTAHSTLSFLEDDCERNLLAHPPCRARHRNTRTTSAIPEQLLSTAAIVSPLSVAVGEKRFSGYHSCLQAIELIGKGRWNGTLSFYIDHNHIFPDDNRQDEERAQPDGLKDTGRAI